MRETFTSLQARAADATQTLTSETANNTFLKTELSLSYRWMLGDLDIYRSRIATAFTTVASTQYYDYPAGMAVVDSISITIGGILYNLVPYESQSAWNILNSVSVAGSNIPQFYLARDLDFGIWPTPQDAYTGSIVYNPRYPDFANEDYTTGTVTVTNGSATVTGSGTTFTAAMVGRWFKVNNDGLWYKVEGYTSATVITIHKTYEGATAAGASYTIGESPQIPEEGHELLVARAAMGFFIKKRGDAEMAKTWDNMFWTGEPHNTIRDPTVVTGGYLGFKHRYFKRSSSGIIYKQSRSNVDDEMKIWGTTLS